MSLRNKIFSDLNSLEMVLSPPPALTEIFSIVFKNDLLAKDQANSHIKDPSLTTRMLRVADLSACVLSEETGDKNYSAAISSPNGAKLLTLSIAVYNQFSGPYLSNDKRSAALWRHFLEIANAAQDIASRIDSSSIEKAYICALLHDFGVIFLERYFPEEASCVRRLIDDGKPILAAEREIYGTDHQEVGFWVATKWNMPGNLIEVIRNHHPADETIISDLPLLTKITILASICVSFRLGSLDNLKEEGYTLKFLERCCSNLGVRVGEIKGIHSVLPKHLLHQIEGINLDKDEIRQHFLQMNNELFDLYLELASMFKERRELSRDLLHEGRMAGTLDSLKLALATLSHYVNNATASIAGQGEILQQLYGMGDKEKTFARIPAVVGAVKKATRKISIVLEELSNITSLEKIDYFKHSRAIDIEKSLKDRLG